MDNIEVLNKQKLDNAIKAKDFLESDSVEEAQKLLSDNDAIDVKIEAIKRVNEQILPVEVKSANEGVKTMEFMNISSVRSAKNLPFEGSHEHKQKTAYAFGQYFKHLNKDVKATNWLDQNGYFESIKAQNETTNSAGGFLVPDELMRELIFLREAYGVARRECRVMPMASDVQWYPVNSASTTGYWVGESTAPTQSQITLDRAEVLAKKLAILTYVSSELAEDSIIDVGAMLAEDMAWKVSQQEDAAVFLGDGTATYGSITGILAAVNSVAGPGKISAAAGSAANWTAVTLANLRSMTGVLPTYAETNAKFYCSKNFYHAVVAAKLDALSGNGFNDIANASTNNPTLFGYPVVFVQGMTNTAAGTTATPLVAFGDLKKATILGDRRLARIQVSDQYAFNTDEIVYRLTERIGFVCHDKGTVSAAGGVVVLNRLT